VKAKRHSKQSPTNEKKILLAPVSRAVCGLIRSDCRPMRSNAAECGDMANSFKGLPKICLTYQRVKSTKEDLKPRLRIWGSEVRILSGAPYKNPYLTCR
jgi:hypothetical protein